MNFLHLMTAKTRFLLVFSIVLPLMTSVAAAVDTISAGASTHNAVWGTNSNWTDGSFPISTDDVVFDRSSGNSGTVLVGANAAQAANSLTFGSGTGTAHGAFSMVANTSGTTARTLTFTTGNVAVHSAWTGAETLGSRTIANFSLSKPAGS